ncbi:MAG: hypothetical protein AAB676_03610 [Verrucomicrobiota bacterium]
MRNMDRTTGTTGPPITVKPSTLRRRMLRGCAWGCGGTVLVCLLVIGLLFIILNRVPKTYPLPAKSIDPPTPTDYTAYALDGFESPYLGHTGSWDGKGGNMWGGSKAPDLDKEAGMGLRWTFMPVNWSALEPDGPVDLNREVPAAWQALDAFVVAAQRRRLNVLMQAPVVGGNAGGPPAWAGWREKGKSAPLKMDALVEFAGKLAQRYRPGGTLATEQGWGLSYGVRAWELDNEPEMYRTHWKGQAADYAEFATLATARIKAMDPKAAIVAPGLAAGKDGLQWLEATLDAAAMAGSPAFRAQGKPYSIGPVVDVVSLHNYEGLDSAFSDGPRTVGQVLEDVRAVFEKWEQRVPGFTYPSKQDYWHTEGNFDFIGALSAERRAAWRIQFFTRAFAAGLRKVCVMDASEREQAAVRAYVQALPWPFPMKPAEAEVKVMLGRAAAFRHPDSDKPEAGQVWIFWAIAGTGDAQVHVPVRRERVTLVQVDGSETVLSAPGHRITLVLKGDRKMAPPVILVDRINGTKNRSSSTP